MTISGPPLSRLGRKERYEEHSNWSASYTILYMTEPKAFAYSEGSNYDPYGYPFGT